MKNIGDFVSENFQFLEMKFSIYLNRSVFVMWYQNTWMCGRSRVFAVHTDINNLLHFICVTVVLSFDHP